MTDKVVAEFRGLENGGLENGRAGIPPRYVTKSLCQLGLLPSARRKISTSKTTVVGVLSYLANKKTNEPGRQKNTVYTRPISYNIVWYRVKMLACRAVWQNDFSTVYAVVADQQISILSFTNSQSPIYQPNWNAKKSA